MCLPPLQAIKHRKLTYPQWLSPAAKDFLKHALQREPAQRPTARQLLSHPLITLHNAMSRRRLSAPVGCPKAALLLLAQGGQGAGSSAAQARVRP
jgi:serine/threonine protein kinase